MRVYSSPWEKPKMDEAERLAALEARLSKLEDRIPADRFPRTMVLADHFLKRAFAIWGHYFVANLIIGLAVAFVVGTFVLALFALGVFSGW